MRIIHLLRGHKGVLYNTPIQKVTWPFPWKQKMQKNNAQPCAPSCQIISRLNQTVNIKCVFVWFLGHNNKEPGLKCTEDDIITVIIYVLISRILQGRPRARWKKKRNISSNWGANESGVVCKYWGCVRAICIVPGPEDKCVPNICSHKGDIPPLDPIWFQLMRSRHE